MGQKAAINDYIKTSLEDDIKSLVTLAMSDLYNGPVCKVAYPEWPGFETACKRISDSLPRGDLWISVQDEILDHEPQFCDGCENQDYHMDMEHEYPDDWSQVPIAAWKRICFGELAPYV